MRHVLVALIVLAGCKSRHENAPAPAPTPAPSGSASPTKASTTAFVDVTVVPMDTDHELEHQTVIVDGTKIVAIGPVASTTVAAGATTIDGKGKWLMPGLIDMHVHFNDERYGTLFIANGVTTVRNMWGREDVLAWRGKARANDPSYFGPSIYTAGAIVDGDPPVWPGSHVVHDAAEAEAEVAAQVADGYDFIKVYDGLPLAAYDALAAAAKKANIRFAGHMPRAVSVAHAIEMGQASVEHLTGYIDWKADPSSFDDAKLAALAKQTADGKLVNTPTLVVLARMGAFDQTEALLARPENKYVPPSLLAGWNPKTDFRTHSMTAADFAKARARNETRHELVKALAAANATILVGTDTPNPFVVPGFSIHEELALLVGDGLTPYQALRGATFVAADWLHDADAGKVAAGARADLVLLDADPLKDITATTKRAGVMVRGTYYSAKQLTDKLDELVASYTKGDRFAKAPALVIPPGDLVFSGSFKLQFAGADVGAERMAIVRTKDGGRIIVAQAANDPPGATLSQVQLELDAKGNLRSYSIDEDGKRSAATLAGGKLHITGSKTADVAFPDDGLLDANVLATMIPFVERAKPGAKTVVAGKMLPGEGKLSDVTYTFDRPAKGASIPFSASGPFGDSPGTYEMDDKGFPTKLSLKTGMGEFLMTRQP